MAKPDFLKWVSTDDAAKITDPGTTKKLSGFLYKERPAFQFVNYLFNKIYRWLVGLQGSYYDVVVGSAAEVTAGEATHTINDLNDTIVTSNSRIFIKAGTNTLTADRILTNNDVFVISEYGAFINLSSTFKFGVNGARCVVEINILNATAAADAVQVSGPGSRLHVTGLDAGQALIGLTTRAFFSLGAQALSERFGQVFKGQDVGGVIGLYWARGAHWDGVQWIADSTNSFIMTVNSANEFRVLVNAGLTPGSPFGPTVVIETEATPTIRGFMSAADKTKLNGIESLATADQTAAEILALLLTVDGAGSNLDADLLDGQSSAFYQDRANHTGTQTAATISDVKPTFKDHGSKAAPYTLQLDEAELHVVAFTAATTLTIASTLATDRATVVVKNGGFAITLAGIDTDAPTLTAAVSTQDFLSIVKSFGKTTVVSAALNKPTV